MVASSPEISPATRAVLVARLTMIAGPPMLKKRHRQPQDVPEESDRLDQRQPDLQPREIDLLQTGRGKSQRGRHGHGPEQRLEPGVVPLDQDLIDEDALERGRDEVGDHQGQPGQDHEDERGLGGREPPDQPQDRAGPLAFPDEMRSGLEGERDAAVTALEFVQADRPAATRRIVQVDLPPPRIPRRPESGSTARRR